jgi:hypothetical protein
MSTIPDSSAVVFRHEARAGDRRRVLVPFPFEQVAGVTSAKPVRRKFRSAITAGIRCFIQIGVNLAHPTRFERVTFAFGGQRWGYYLCLPKIPWNYRPPDIGSK